VYDPVKDLLSASTRNGATLDLKIGILGLFTTEHSEVYIQKEITRILENNPGD
jgi:hypothetical protein